MSHRLKPRGGAKNDQPELIAEADEPIVQMSKVESKGDWGSYDDTLDGKKLVDGELLIVRWPDGHLDQIAVTVKLERGSVSDHGKEYTTYSSVSYYVTQLRGVKIDLPLRGLEAQRVA
jgi:hypothetical protein